MLKLVKYRRNVINYSLLLEIVLASKAFSFDSKNIYNTAL